MMFHRLQSKQMVAFALVTLGLALLSACGSPAEKLNQQGNEAFAKQAFQDALQAYASAKIESPELAEPYYNAANVLYRQEKYAEALEEIQKALAQAEDDELEERGHYNKGNASFNTQEWETAVEAYKAALLLNPDDQDAKHNLELALQQQEQQEQQQQQQQQDQDQQSEDGEGQQDQNQQEEENQSQEGDQEQEQDQPQKGDQQGQDQSQESDGGEEQNQDQNGDQSDQSKANDGQNFEDQEQQNQQNGQGAPQDGQQDSNQEPQPAQMPAPGERMTEEQARQLLEAIAQDSDTLQERLGQFFFVPAGPPVQDW
jgi:Ca-activated chloride channel family protein